MFLLDIAASLARNTGGVMTPIKTNRYHVGLLCAWDKATPSSTLSPINGHPGFCCSWLIPPPSISRFCLAISITISDNPVCGGSCVSIMRSDLNLIFGPYRLKVGTGLWRHDNEIRLPPKEMALLELLAENRGDVVEHEVIYKYLWPRHVVSYASLARCVYSLRSALDPEGKELIVTVPRRGYKLAVPVKGSAKQDQLSAIEKTTQTKPLAYAHFQAGMACANNPQAGSLERALHWFEMSARVDPDFAASHSKGARPTEEN